MTERERKEFEKHIAKTSNGNVSYKDMCINWNGKGYNSTWLDLQWSGWQASATRQGYKLVPIEPSDEMRLAAYKQYDTGLSSMTDIYKAMIGAVE